MMKSAGKATQLNYSFNVFYKAPSHSLLTSGNISCGLLHRSNLSDKLSSNASGGVEADSDSAIVFRYFDIRYIRDHCYNYRREGKRGRREGLEGGSDEVEGAQERGRKEQLMHNMLRQ